LTIVERCRCGDDFCASFYTQPKPKESYGPGHDSMELEPTEGMLILDIVDGRIAHVEILHRNDILDGRIAHVEILHRNDIRQKLLEVLP
jgi:hypothetical protein